MSHPTSNFAIDLEDQLRSFQVAVLDRCVEQIKNKSIAIQITNKATISYLKQVNPIDEYVWIDKNLSKTVEGYFVELRLYCFKYAIEITSNPELAEDIAQESIQALLQSANQIEFVKGWLKTTTINKARQSIKNTKREELIIQKIHDSKLDDPDPNTINEADLYRDLPSVDVRKLLSRKDYKDYQRIKKYKNLKEYAKAEGLSYQTAREHSHKIRTNLKAAYFRSKGWIDGSEILDYRLLLNFKQFLNRMIEVFGAKQEGKFTKNSIRMNIQDVYEVFDGVTSMADWGVAVTGQGKYKLNLCFASPDTLVMITLHVLVNKANRIILQNCSREVPKTIGRIPDDLADQFRIMLRDRTMPKSQADIKKFVEDAGYEIIEGSCIREVEEKISEMKKNKS